VRGGRGYEGVPTSFVCYAAADATYCGPQVSGHSVGTREEFAYACAAALHEGAT